MDIGRLTPELSQGLVKALNDWAKRLLKGDFLLVFEGKDDHCRIGFIRDGVQRAFPAYSLFLVPETLQVDEHTGRTSYVAPAESAENSAPKPKTKAKKPSK